SVVCCRANDQALLCYVGCLSDCSVNICALCHTDANLVFAVTHDNKCLESETTSTFYHTGNAVEVDYQVFELLWVSRVLVAAVVTTRATRRASVSSSLFGHIRAPNLPCVQRQQVRLGDQRTGGRCDQTRLR